jgi:ABC-type antimicrobial peptide transport system permease subunit
VTVNIGTMQERIRAVSERPRFTAMLLGLFALVGVVLAAGGLYGLTSYLVAQQRPELGLRLALGAQPTQLAVFILSHVLRWTLTGVLVGFTCTALAVRYLRALLFHVSAENFQLFAAAALVMLAVATIAALEPSIRAARIDPVATLRHD